MRADRDAREIERRVMAAIERADAPHVALMDLFEGPDAEASLAMIAARPELGVAVRRALHPVFGDDRRRRESAPAALDAMRGGADESPDARLDRLFDGVLGGYDALAVDDAAERERARATAALRDEIQAEIGVLRKPVAIALGSIDAGHGGDLARSTPGVVWLPRAFEPRSRQGRALMAHELAHEAQRAVPGAADLGAAEREAEAIMGAVWRGEPARAPRMALPATAMAACGPRAMQEAQEEEAPAEDEAPDKKDPTPGKKAPPASGGRPQREDGEGILEIDEMPEKPEPPESPPPPPPPPAPEATEAPRAERCDEPCPEPLPEHLAEMPVKTPPAEADKGDGEERKLTISGHIIHFRLPKGATAGQVRVTFREADSPYATLTLKSAMLVLGADGGIASGKLTADVRLGRFVQVPSALLTIAAGGVVALKIRDARLQIGSIARGKVDLDVGRDGVSGTGVLTARDVKTTKGLRLSEGLLQVRVDKAGAVTAHGKLGVELVGIGEVALDACFVDGELTGKLTVTIEKDIPLGLGRIRRIVLSGCLKKAGWSLHGEVDLIVRDWVSALVVADVRGGAGMDPLWVVQGDVHQERPIELGPVAVHDAHLTVKWHEDHWEPARGEVHYRMPHVMGVAEGSVDLASGEVNGRGEATLTEPLDLGIVSLDEGRLEAVIDKSELTEIIGQATVSLKYEGQPTFEVDCIEAIYDARTKEVHARGEMRVLREVVLGAQDGLHAAIPHGHAGTFAFEHGRLAHVASTIRIEVSHGADAIGRGGIGFAYSEADGISGDVTMGLVGRTGLPDHAQGPFFLLPGASFRIDVTRGALGDAVAEAAQWELENAAGSGCVVGQVDGRFDFGQGRGSLSGQAWVHEPWILSLRAAAAEVRLIPGSEARVALGGEGEAERAIHGSLRARFAVGGKDIAEGDLQVGWDPARDVLDARGSAALLEDWSLTQGATWGLAIKGGTKVGIDIGDGELREARANVALAAAHRGVDVAVIDVDGDWQLGETADGASSELVNGTARVRVIERFTLFEKKAYAFGFGPSRFEARLAAGEIAHVGGRFALRAEPRGSADEAPLGALRVELDGSYDKPEGDAAANVDGSGSIAVDGELSLAQAGEYALHLCAGSDATIVIAASEVTALDGHVVGRVDIATPRDGESAAFLGIDAEAHYRPEDGGKVDALGGGKMLGRRRIFQAGDYAFWLAPGIDGATEAHLVIEDNAVMSLDGRIGAEVHDGKGCLLELTVGGRWSAADGKLDGAGRARLARDLTFPDGATKGPRVVLMAGSSGAANVDKSRLRGVDGVLIARVIDDRGELVEIVGCGHLDAERGRLEHAEGGATLKRPIEIGGSGAGALVRITTLSGSGTIEDGKLRSVQGVVVFELPRLGKGFIGRVGGGWRHGEAGKDDVVWGTGRLAMPIIDNGKRRLAGEVDVTVGEDGKWSVNGLLDYQLAPRIGGKVGVALDETMDPEIEVDFDVRNARLADGRTLFEKDLDLLPPLPIGVAPVSAELGLRAGVSLKMDDLVVASAHIGADPWRPLSEERDVPTFDSDLALTWGLDAHAARAAYLVLKLGLGSLASLHAGIEAELALDVPLRLAPKGRLWGGPDGLGGELDVSVTIAPKLGLGLTPFVGGEVLGFDVARHELDTFVVDLGVPLPIEWGTRYAFGDVPKPPTRLPASEASADGARVTQKPVSHTEPPRFPTRAAERRAAEPGLPAIGAEAEAEGDQSGLAAFSGEGGGGKIAALLKAIEALGRLGEAAQAYLEVASSPETFLIPGRASVVLKAAWERVAVEGRALYAACEGAFGSLKESVPKWVRLIVEAPPGATPTAFQAWSAEDDVSRQLVAEGVHATLSLAERVQLVGAMLRGSCGDEDEGAILDVLRHARRAGDVRALLAEVGVKRLKSNFHGDEHDALLAFLTELGVDE